MPIDQYHLRSPIENVWERLAVNVFVVKGIAPSHPTLQNTWGD